MHSLFAKLIGTSVIDRDAASSRIVKGPGISAKDAPGCRNSNEYPACCDSPRQSQFPPGAWYTPVNVSKSELLQSPEVTAVRWSPSHHEARSDIAPLNGEEQSGLPPVGFVRWSWGGAGGGTRPGGGRARGGPAGEGERGGERQAASRAPPAGPRPPM